MGMLSEVGDELIEWHTWWRYIDTSIGMRTSEQNNDYFA